MNRFVLMLHLKSHTEQFSQE